jgi:hypothetical protein
VRYSIKKIYNLTYSQALGSIIALALIALYYSCSKKVSDVAYSLALKRTHISLFEESKFLSLTR